MTFALTLLAAISLAGCADGIKPDQASQRDTNQNQNLKDAQAALPAALQNARHVKVSEVKFDGLPLGIVLSSLQDECLKRDPAGKGIAIALGPEAKQFADTQVHLELKEVTLAEALERIADSVGLQLQATDTELLLVGKNAK